MAQLTEIIPSQNFELIRNRIGEILAVEIANQFSLTNKVELDAKVYNERIVPFAHNQMPAVNVMFSGGDYDLQTQVKTDGTYRYFIDCYSSATTEGANDGDKLALTRLHTLLGVCRAILEAPVYKTLSFERPSIERRFVSSVEISQPDNNQDGTSSVFGRLTFEVRIPETVELQKTKTLLGFDTSVSLGLTPEGYYWSSDEDGDLPPPLCAGVLVTDSDGVTKQTVPSGGVFACTPTIPAPQNINYVPIPLTGQTVSYTLYDDGWRFQNGLYTRTVNEGITPLLTDFYTLDASTPNAFGNTNRFTNDLGNQVLDGSDTSTVGYFIDHYTGKGYVKSSSSMTRDNHITTAIALTLGSYSGFNLTNMEEVDMIAPCNSVLSFPFNIVTPGANKYHTSTTSSTSPSNGKVLGQAWDLVNIGHKTHSINAITGVLNAFYIRNHYTL